ncbi:zinc-dependent peptidase [Synechocystis salina LEGE 06155]|nr:zinc-dependent peptidase [Synechocystis salina LEGE 06155]
MLPTAIVLAILLGIIAYIWGYPHWLDWREKQLFQRPLPPHWQAILGDRLPFYQQLSPQQRQKLAAKIQLFLQQKQFIGCNDFVLTDEVRLVIAAQACYLALELGSNPYPRLDTILVYPDAFQVRQVSSPDGYVVEEEETIRAGESWDRAGQLILAWGTIAWDLERWQDGHNVIFHEFAHQLDMGDGAMNGVPKLARRNDYQRWQSIFAAEYQQLLSQLEHNLPTVIDPYGSTNPCEFFAVVTETFFEKGQELQRHHGQLYQVLQKYYCLEPLVNC